MSGTLLSLVESVQARQTCPACEGPRQPHALPTQWHHNRAIFSCGAVFIARGETIEVERPCGDRSALCAELWTIQAKGQNEAVVSSASSDCEDGRIAGLILALAVTATKAGFDHLTICEIIRDEMATFASRASEGEA
jgi:hypothetical protein